MAKQDEETVAIEMPERGRKTLNDQGKSLLDVTTPAESTGILPDTPFDETALRNYDYEVRTPPQTTEKTMNENTQAKGLPVPVREQVLKEAAEAVTHDRAQDYGPADENFERIAMHWEAIFGHGVTEAQVAQCMAAVKLARLSHQPSHRDSWVDLAGYSALGAELAGK